MEDVWASFPCAQRGQQQRGISGQNVNWWHFQGLHPRGLQQAHPRGPQETSMMAQGAGEGGEPCSTWGAACRRLLRGRRGSPGAALRESHLVLVGDTAPESGLHSLCHGSNLRSQGLQRMGRLHCTNSKHNPRGLPWASYAKPRHYHTQQHQVQPPHLSFKNPTATSLSLTCSNLLGQPGPYKRSEEPQGSPTHAGMAAALGTCLHSAWSRPWARDEGCGGHGTCLAQIGHLQAHICSWLAVGHGSEPEDAWPFATLGVPGENVICLCVACMLQQLSQPADSRALPSAVARAKWPRAGWHHFSSVPHYTYPLGFL